MSILNSIRAQFVPIHREGYPFIGGFALVSLVLLWLTPPLGWLGVAPAGGRVSRIAEAAPPG